MQQPALPTLVTVAVCRNSAQWQYTLRLAPLISGTNTHPPYATRSARSRHLDHELPSQSTAADQSVRDVEERECLCVLFLRRTESHSLNNAVRERLGTPATTASSAVRCWARNCRLRGAVVDGGSDRREPRRGAVSRYEQATGADSRQSSSDEANHDVAPGGGSECGRAPVPTGAGGAGLGDGRLGV